MSAPMKPVELTVVDTNTAEWQGFPVEYINATLEHIPLVNDADTGMMVLKMVYRAGFTNPWHSHPCAHGVYVLEGTLNTHRGQFGAGSFVWFPEGGIMEHGRPRTRT
jgi:quercetin dioxygenase-like cupin family protein